MGSLVQALPALLNLIRKCLSNPVYVYCLVYYNEMWINENVKTEQWYMT